MTVDADDDTRESVSARMGARSWVLTGGVLAVFLVAILAASVAGRPFFELGQLPSEPLPLPGDAPTPTGTPTAQPPLDGSIDTLMVIIGIVLALAALALIVILLIALIRTIVAAWRNRPLRRQAGAGTDVDVHDAEAATEAEPDAPTVRRGIAAARVAVDAEADPTDAIVAAWLGLEETAADSGVGRARSETQVEFTLRMLLRRPGIDDPARRLLRLYEGVRFGGRLASEQERAAAARALALIEAGWR